MSKNKRKHEGDAPDGPPTSGMMIHFHEFFFKKYMKVILLLFLKNLGVEQNNILSKGVINGLLIIFYTEHNSQKWVIPCVVLFLVFQSMLLEAPNLKN